MRGSLLGKVRSSVVGAMSYYIILCMAHRVIFVLIRLIKMSCTVHLASLPGESVLPVLVPFKTGLIDSDSQTQKIYCLQVLKTSSNTAGTHSF